MPHKKPIYPHIEQSTRFRSENGNVFFIILIGIVMFAALMYTFSRSTRQGTESLGNREAELAASEILAYAQKIERGVQRVLSRQISEVDLSFANDFDGDYVNPNCSVNQCLVFHPEGGAVAWQTPPEGVNSGENYEFVANQVANALEPADLTAIDLVILLPVNLQICAALNALTTKIDAWESDGTPNVANEYLGNFAGAVGSRIAWSVAPDTRWTGCFCEGSAPCDAGDPHYFYHVIHRRG
ncbi:MAG: hypothetical protein HYS17_02675 [Micavibrio aeruginosavorus]|uniref:Uncharacterized protein n=1 Tax=Micavibrio aeruginosavorus TaxID=349221 RepID=A0A7T5R377_9BACT|nr:MAG: hypothetical protein HYS17_02675 [Micavibrio aeruginosavorus]